MLVDDVLVDDKNQNSFILFTRSWRMNCLKAEMENMKYFNPLISFVIGRSFGVGIKTAGG